MIQRLLNNHVLVNLVCLVVLAAGLISYLNMPRQRDPDINFNWITVTTTLPGASAGDVERLVTGVLEDALRKVGDVRFVSSDSRESVSTILVRFADIDATRFSQRLADLRRELQDKAQQLPAAAGVPQVVEVTSANSFPTAIVVVTGPAFDEPLRRQAELARQDIERITGVAGVQAMGLAKPELRVDFLPQRLQAVGLAPTDLAATVQAYYRDVAAGSLRVNDQQWLIRLAGTDNDPAYLAQLPLLTAHGEVPLGSVAEVSRARQQPAHLVRYQGRPAVMLAVTKQPKANILDLLQRLQTYINERNQRGVNSGVQLILADDQTYSTRAALGVMQNNALLGLVLVLLVTWAFLGWRSAALTALGIPFTLAGTFWVLHALGATVNITVLLGVVISLGMLVDDAVVVAEAISLRLQQGMHALQAARAALAEVCAPVITAVLTTMAAFLPLLLLPGILGQFMAVIPTVVCIALAISLLEAYWILPAHLIGAAAHPAPAAPASLERRRRCLQRLRRGYSRCLLRVMRRPRRALAAVGLLFVLALTAPAAGWIKLDFFASDPIRLFYVNIEMPSGTPIDKTLDKVQQVEDKVRAGLRPGEARSVVSYAGQMFTATSPFIGAAYGQVMVALNPAGTDSRTVDELIDALRTEVLNTPGPVAVSFLRLAGGPPLAKPVSIKVRGDRFEDLEQAVAALKSVMRTVPGVREISDDAAHGQLQLGLRVDLDAARRAGIDPSMIARSLRLLVDGEVVASVAERGETLDLRVRAQPAALPAADALLDYVLPTPDGRQIQLRALLHPRTDRSRASIRHYNFRRTITVEAELDTALSDTLSANQAILAGWRELRHRYPDIELDFSGELDDIQQSLNALGLLFLLGLGLIYLLLGAHFRSYFQPLMVLLSVPLALSGVSLGLLLSGNPLSLYALYGAVALTGITVNTAIVFISAANARLAAGMPAVRAAVYAARRRVVPILITSLTTVAGLLSLATGLAGRSLLWGPVATTIVCGLLVSTALTLFAVPVVYQLAMRRSAKPVPGAARAPVARGAGRGTGRGAGRAIGHGIGRGVGHGRTARGVRGSIEMAYGDHG